MHAERVASTSAYSYAATAAECGTAELNLNSQLPPAGGMNAVSHLERRLAWVANNRGRVIVSPRESIDLFIDDLSDGARDRVKRFIYVTLWIRVCGCFVFASEHRAPYSEMALLFTSVLLLARQSSRKRQLPAERKLISNGCDFANYATLVASDQFEGIRARRCAREIFRARDEIPLRACCESHFLRFSAAGAYFRRGCPPSRRQTAGGLK